MAIVGIRRVLLCAFALGLVVPGVASAAINLDPFPTPTNTAPIPSFAGDGADPGPYDVLRGNAACSSFTVATLAVDGHDTAFDAPTPLPDATYCYRVADQNTLSVSTDRPVTFDTVTNPPSFTAPADGSLQNGTFPISFSNSDAATPVTTTAVASPHNAGTFTPRAGLSTGSWDSTQVADGEWDVLLSSQDSLLNLAATDMITITIDNTAPSLTPTLPSDNTFVSGNVSVTYSASDVLSGVPSVVLEVDPPGVTSWTQMDSGSHHWPGTRPATWTARTACASRPPTVRAIRRRPPGRR